ncbi:hypothetical protein TYRP_002856 [Tyrophagus putrescentiae]|nr:hypothetical protein TYRP_002856 [Tyrophagus putrescentiae]
MSKVELLLNLKLLTAPHCSSLHQVGEGRLEAPLQLLKGDDEHVLRVPRHQADLLAAAHVHLIEIGDDMAQVEPRPALLVALVKEVVAKELQHVPVARLRPVRVELVLRPLVDGAQLGQEAKEAAIVRLLRQLLVEVVVAVVEVVELHVEAGANHRHDVIDGARLIWVGRRLGAQQVADERAQVRRVAARHQLQALRQQVAVGRGRPRPRGRGAQAQAHARARQTERRQAVGGQRQAEAAKEEEVLLLKVRHQRPRINGAGAAAVVVVVEECKVQRENVRHAGKGEAKAGVPAPVAEGVVGVGAPAAGEEDLGGVEGATGETRLVDDAQRRGDLYDALVVKTCRRGTMFACVTFFHPSIVAMSSFALALLGVKA